VEQLIHYNEEDLVRKAFKGNLDAFNQLVLQYQDLAFRHSYSLLGDPDSAEDATQESFIKAFQNIRNFRGGSFRAWLLKIVTNTSYDFLRRSKRHPLQPLFPKDEDGEEIESPTWLVDPSPSVEYTVEQIETGKHLQNLVDELPEIYRSVLTLVDLYELDSGEAAEILNIPLGTVKSRLSRARLQMMRKLQGDLDFFPYSNQRMTAIPA
jgi:RNA polymerase sigma-70 factor (ECF subfamily)